MRFALNALPETFINILQSFVSARRIEKYLALAEVTPVAPLGEQNLAIAFNSATVSWPQERAGGSGSASAGGSVMSTPGKRFVLIDLNLRFPSGELTLVCGKLGSGKSLLLLCESLRGFVGSWVVVLIVRHSAAWRGGHACGSGYLSKVAA